MVYYEEKEKEIESNKHRGRSRTIPLLVHPCSRKTNQKYLIPMSSLGKEKEKEIEAVLLIVVVVVVVEEESVGERGRNNNIAPLPSESQRKKSPSAHRKGGLFKKTAATYSPTSTQYHRRGEA